ncbi:MAG: undecaprenyl diphosphate synthase family protein [Candidatus Margulisbacteria bacterium]|nr:undecaprenyl diphosphate synthase family protein [Candidatus Margulisiibacteriota bacterium]
MDGNGRWAQAKALPRIAGHKEGAESLREILKASAEFGVKYLTDSRKTKELQNKPEMWG